MESVSGGGGVVKPRAIAFLQPDKSLEDTFVHHHLDGYRQLSDNPHMPISLANRLNDIVAICERYGVAHLELFGSATGPNFQPETSDYDFLVELDTEMSGSRARRWTELADALEKLLGRPVDLVNPRYIRNPYFLKAINSSRTVIYDRQNAQAAG